MLLFAITREQHQGFNDALLSWKHQSFRIAIALLPYPPVGDNWPVCEKVINHFGCPKDPSQWFNRLHLGWIGQKPNLLRWLVSIDQDEIAIRQVEKWIQNGI
jgi:hypothetical protein